MIDPNIGKIIAYAISLGKAWGVEITAIQVIDQGRGIPGGRVKEKELEREVEAKRPAEDFLASWMVNGLTPSAPP